MMVTLPCFNTSIQKTINETTKRCNDGRAYDTSHTKRPSLQMRELLRKKWIKQKLVCSSTKGLSRQCLRLERDLIVQIGVSNTSLWIAVIPDAL